MWRRALIALSTLVALVVVSIPAWVALHSRDLPEVDDADLMLDSHRSERAEGEDAWVWFRAAGEALLLDDSAEMWTRVQELLQRERTDPDWVAANVDANTRAYEMLEAGLRASHIHIPPWPLHDRRGPLDVVFPVQGLVRLSAADAQRLADRGHPQQALERALLGMRVGRKLSEAPAPQLVTMMVAVSTQGISLMELERLMPALGLPARETHRLAARLEDLRIDSQSWQRTWSAEYRWTKDLYENLADESWDSSTLVVGEKVSGLVSAVTELGPVSEYLFQPNRTLSRHAAMYRDLVDASRRVCHETWSSRPRAPELDRGWKLRTLLFPNPVGNLLFTMSQPDWSRFDLKRCHLETRISLLQTGLAIDAHRRERGDLPATLQALVPRYLDAVPKDRFDGEPIRWSRERATLYSVGDDFVDDGPPEAPSQTDEHAPAVRLPTAS